MKIEVDISDVKQLGKQLSKSGNEIEDIRSQLHREMGRLSLRSKGRAEVDQAYSLIKRALQELEQGLQRYGVALDKKAEDFKEADGKAPSRDWSKAWEVFKFGLSIGLDFVPVVGNVKGVIEALVGRDLITGAKLTWYERVLSAVGPLGKGASKGAKLLKFADEAVGGISKFVKATNTAVTVINDGKGIVEGLVGRDLITGEELSTSQRVMSMLGVGGFAIGAKKGLGFASEVVDSSKRLKHVDKVSTVLSEGTHKKNKMVAEAVAAGSAGGATATSMLSNKKGSKAIDEVAATATIGKKELGTRKGNEVIGGSAASSKIDTKQAKDKSGILDPIHAGTGHQFMNHDVIKLYGATTWKVELQYNSGLTQRSELGLAWSHNYAIKLTFEESQQEVQEERQLNGNPKIIHLWWNAGRCNSFAPESDGVYRSTDSWVIGDELTEVQDGYVLKLRNTRERYFFSKEGKLQRHVTASGLSLEASYNNDGYLSELTDSESGRALHFYYEKVNKLLTRISTDKRNISFEYDPEGWMSAYYDANGHVTTFTCDKLGHILTMSTEGKIDFSNTYDEEYRIVEQRDAKGLATCLAYDTLSRPGYTITTIRNRMGETSQYIHNEQLLLVEKRNGEGQIETYRYNAHGQEIEHQRAGSDVQRRYYDKRGRLIQLEDALGHSTWYAYNERDLLIEERNAQGGVTTYDYDDADRLLGITRPDGASCLMTYHLTGQLATYTDYAGGITGYQYGSDGVVCEVKDAEGRSTLLIQDEAGRIVGVQDSLGGCTKRKYDNLDQLVQMVDQAGRTWNYEYDAYGQMIRIEAPDGGITKYSYTGMGQLASVCYPLGQKDTYHYDAEDRLISHENAYGGVTKLVYDLAGRVIQVSDPMNRRKSYKYDEQGRILSIVDGLGQLIESLQYDSAGRVLAVTNGLGHTVKRRWNELNQIIAQTEADGVQTTYHYDSLARLQRVVQGEGSSFALSPSGVNDVFAKLTMPTPKIPNNINDQQSEAACYEQLYDPEHRVIAYRDGNGHETKLSYDLSGRLLQEENSCGGLLGYQYDARGWLIQRENARGQAQQFLYDASGLVTKLQDEAGELQLTYDNAGRWIHSREGTQEMKRTYDVMGRVMMQQEVWGHHIYYRYDDMGNLTHLTYPDGKVVEYRYNLAGELTEVKDWAGRLTKYRYDENGRLIEQHRPNGTKESRKYDAVGQLIAQIDTTKQGISLQQFKYQYNEVGQLIKEQDKQYTYDRFRRLISGKDQGTITYFGYDQGGNLTGQLKEDIFKQTNDKKSLEKWSYSADNRVKAWNNYPTELDADGNLLYVTNGEQMGDYEYDSRNRLIKSGRMKYTYNWKNERVECKWKGKVTRYIVDDVGSLSHVLMEVDEAGETIATYVYGLGLIGRENGRSGAYVSYHYDLRGSTTLLTNEHGQVADRYAYGVYGELVQHEGDTIQPFQYNGQDGVMHDTNGLYYMRARYYHAGLKRFLNRDVIKGTLVEGQTLNRYAYVNGDPVNYVDPLGLSRDSKGKSDPNVNALNDLINELNTHDGAKTIEDVNILKEWSNEYGVGKKFNYVETPYGYALQSLSDDAISMRDYVTNSGDLFRGGTVGRSKTIDGQFWATESPLTKGYADKYGVDFTSMDFVQSGKLKTGTNFITRPAPALNGNKGGGIEVVTPPKTVKLNSFNILD